MLSGKEFEEGYSKTYKCYKCGYCCKKAPCAFGVWDDINNKCKYLTTENLCENYEEINKNPFSVLSPAFNAGCCSPLGNTARNKKMKETSGK